MRVLETARRSLLAALAAATLLPVLSGAGLGIEPQHLTSTFRNLSDGDRATLDRAIALIREGENTEALTVLAGLKEANPENSGVRLMVAYVLLQVGNQLGAFDEAEKAESQRDHNSYVCLFLARIAFLTGKPAVCERELEHVRAAGLFKRQAQELEDKLREQKRASP